MSIPKKISSLKWITPVVYIALAVALVYIVVKFVNGIGSAEVSIGSDNTINITPERITSIKSIGQWEFMQVDDEVVIDTIRHRHIVADDRLTCIYYGSVRLGIDLDKAAADWITNRNDTIDLLLPAPSVLDDRFIDEARTDVFYQTGRWGGYARELMYRRAVAEMKAFALSPENIRTVKSAAESRFTDLFMGLGAKEVTVSFEP